MSVDASPVDNEGPVDGGDWVSVSDLARLRGVSRQAISKRVKALSAAGRLSVRGEGKSLRLHRPTFDEIAAATHDPAQDLRNRHRRNEQLEIEEPETAPVRAEPTRPPAANQTAYDEAATRDKQATAELRELELAHKKGELIPVREIEEAAVEAATKIARAIDLKTKSGRLYAAAHQGGEAAVHVMLVEIENAIRGQIAEAMAKLAARGAEESD